MFTLDVWRGCGRGAGGRMRAGDWRHPTSKSVQEWRLESNGDKNHITKDAEYIPGRVTNVAEAEAV